MLGMPDGRRKQTTIPRTNRNLRAQTTATKNGQSDTDTHTPDWTVSPTRHFFSRHWCERRSVQGLGAELKV